MDADHQEENKLLFNYEGREDCVGYLGHSLGHFLALVGSTWMIISCGLKTSNNESSKSSH